MMIFFFFWRLIAQCYWFPSGLLLEHLEKGQPPGKSCQVTDMTNSIFVGFAVSRFVSSTMVSDLADFARFFIFMTESLQCYCLHSYLKMK